MAEELTIEQRQAVENRGGKLLVSAAAGSGKTKVLVDRLMGYLTDPTDPANIDEFLMITYTKAAAAELRGKIAAKLSQRIAQEPGNRHLQQQLQRLYLAKISTVHSFCGDLLREYVYRLDIPGDFRVADESECEELRISVVEKVLERAYESAAENPKFRAFVDSQGMGRNDSQLPKIILKVFDSARCHLSPEKWMEQCLSICCVEGLNDASETEYGRYLIEQLHSWLDMQIEALTRCVALCRESTGFENPAALLSDTIWQLQQLRECDQWDAVVEKKGVEFGTLRFKKEAADLQLREQLKIVRNQCKEGLASQVRYFANDSKQVLQDLQKCSQAVEGLLELVREFEREYTRLKVSRRILDFGDLEHRTLDLLWGKNRSQLTAAATEIGKRFREIMVDEYQDSNEVQDSIYRALSEHKQNLFMVGDVKQSIYQFRLADPGIFLKKYGSYVPAAEAEHGQGRKVILSKNFRSSVGVLEAANDVFRHCMCPAVGGLYYGKEEALNEGFKHVSLGSPEAELYCIDVQKDTYKEEAAFVAHRIRDMLEAGTPVRDGDTLRPVRPEDIVILMVAPGPCGGYFQRALERVGIRCSTGGGVDLLQTEEIGALRSLLQAIYNPRLDIPLIAAMASPIFGFTANELAQIRGRDRACGFYDVLRRDESEKTAAFLQTLAQLRQAVHKNSLTGLLEEIWVRTGMDDVYAAMDGGDTRRKNLQTFFQFASNFESGGNSDLGRFLEYLDNMEKGGLKTAGDPAGSGAVTIMSIHKSKGLEFPVVFLCCLGREFNMEARQASVLCHKDMGLGLYSSDNAKRIRYPTIAKAAISAQISAETISEQLRVLYVAMTRPKDRLIMTYASNSLEKELTEMVVNMDILEKELLVRSVVCPGEWVLLSALRRSEAGELFALGGYPAEHQVSKYPWHIQVVQSPALTETAQEEIQRPKLPQTILSELQEALSFQYPHSAAVEAPSKQTATQLKGRVKDQEARENADTSRVRNKNWRKAKFQAETLGGKDYGNAIHAVMQYIDYAPCGDAAGVDEEIRRLVREGYISQQQAEMADRKKVAAFFATDIGFKLRFGTESVREFKFSILEDGGRYDPGLSGERILLQGVVDCALIEDDGITVIDYKTDWVTGETLQTVTERYRTQVQVYCDALSRIYCKPVKKALLYFFQLGRFVCLS